MPTVTTRLADFAEPRDQQAVLELLDMYARDPFGGNEPLGEEVRQRLIPDLAGMANCRAVLAWNCERPVGLAVCFLGYSTFQARPLLNIHDLAVAPEARGQGVGRALLAAVEQEARRNGCCRLTLEVRADNRVAQRLYQDFGFEPGNPQSDAHGFWKKPLD
jgi:ribosomal protein S18 acetylase RimI-like enzyme